MMPVPLVHQGASLMRRLGQVGKQCPATRRMTLDRSGLTGYRHETVAMPGLQGQGDRFTSENLAEVIGKSPPAFRKIDPARSGPRQFDERGDAFELCSHPPRLAPGERHETQQTRHLQRGQSRGLAPVLQFLRPAKNSTGLSSLDGWHGDDETTPSGESRLRHHRLSLSNRLAGDRITSLLQKISCRLEKSPLQDRRRHRQFRKQLDPACGLVTQFIGRQGNARIDTKENTSKPSVEAVDGVQGRRQPLLLLHLREGSKQTDRNRRGQGPQAHLPNRLSRGLATTKPSRPGDDRGRRGTRGWIGLGS